uniref:Uncharacterized protein n=1 Tax=Pipistrellus kuhlii TaxID=59472 RepID=A0A7J7V678_PIPKU|nr:hypothetical protein mPipKuh1_008586 [Pipistrellus kuhlii]
MKNSSAASSPPPFEEQKPPEQPAPDQGAAAKRADRPTPRSRSPMLPALVRGEAVTHNLHLFHEQQLGEWPTLILGAVAVHAAHVDLRSNRQERKQPILHLRSSRCVRSLHPYKLHQPGKQTSPVQETAAS